MSGYSLRDAKNTKLCVCSRNSTVTCLSSSIVIAHSAIPAQSPPNPAKYVPVPFSGRPRYVSSWFRGSVRVHVSLQLKPSGFTTSPGTSPINSMVSVSIAALLPALPPCAPALPPCAPALPPCAPALPPCAPALPPVVLSPDAPPSSLAPDAPPVVSPNAPPSSLASPALPTVPPLPALPPASLPPVPLVPPRRLLSPPLAPACPPSPPSLDEPHARTTNSPTPTSAPSTFMRMGPSYGDGAQIWTAHYKSGVFRLAVCGQPGTNP